jgi:hypothetical protein
MWIIAERPASDEELIMPGQRHLSYYTTDGDTVPTI